MKQQHHPQDIKTYEKGINSDSNKEILGSSPNGEHLDALNMRSISMDGDNFAKKKIKGEEILFPLEDNRCNPIGTLTFTGYECMMAQEVNGHIVEIWASSVVGEDPIIRVDGIIVAYSSDLPFDLDHPLQYDKNESCIGGEIYVTNNNTPPLVFSIKDLMDNSGMNPDTDCTETYFTDFNVEDYTVQVSATLYKPAFIKQVSGASGYDVVVGTSGLCVGSYSYSYRFVDDQGEATPFSHITELIPVVRNSSPSNAPQYPYSRTFSSEPNVTSSTPYGNHIRIRYENDSQFKFLELRRDSWYAGDPIGVPPVSEIIASIPVIDGMDVIDVLDRAESSFEGSTILTLDEQTDTGSTIRRAKAIRYYNERLYLMNIGYDAKNIEGQIGWVDDTTNGVFSTIENMGKPGHKHVYNAAMHKSNMRGEKTGFGVVLFDKNNNPSYATEIPNATNFEFPNRRDEIQDLTETNYTSYKGVVRAANTDGAVSKTHEVFDHYDATVKTGQQDDRSVDPYLYNYKDDETYEALSPTSQFDTRNKLNKAVNSRVAPDSDATPFWQDYSPQGFGLNYYSQGFGFKGINDWPSWADGFSVVQTNPAQQVIAQGLGFYSLTPADSGFGADTQKDKDSFWGYFPDLELLYPDIANDIINNPNAYSLQLVSPLGYFTEVYSSRNDTLAQRRKSADMITYARILRDSEVAQRINPIIASDSGISDPAFPILQYKYVAYGRYTNYSTGDSPAFNGNANGNALFPILEFDEVTTNSTRQGYFKVRVDDSVIGSIYNTATMSPSVNKDAQDLGVMEWREPMYVINIIKNTDINPGLTTQYRYGANFIKFKSLILESNGTSNQSAVLVSERWEDCIPQISGQISPAYTNVQRFVYVEDLNGVSQRWLNVEFFSPGDLTTVLTGLAAGVPYNNAVFTDGFDIYGVYTSTETPGDSDGVCRIFTLNFNNISGYTQFTTIPLGYKVYVQYDNRIPVRVFGGDTYINESIWAPIDNNYGNNGEPSGTDGGWLFPDNEFKMNAPFPLKTYEYVDTYPMWEESGTGWNYNFNEQFEFCNSLGLQSSLIRQLVTVWTAETRINLSFAWNVEQPDKAVSDQYYPLINYIPRPNKWEISDPGDKTQFESDNKISPQYFDDYGYEWNLWDKGGFRFTMGNLQTNLDYSKTQTTNTFTTIPAVGFEEQTDFCTRIVWSLKRPMNVQNTPSVKTFPSNNYFDISDDTGEIKFGWSALSNDKGNNLYAFTDSGVCLLLVDKRVIHEINANELATVGSDIGGILNQLWIDKTIGMSDETWRSWAEYSNAIFFANGISAYTFSDNQLTEIARTGFFELLNRKYNQLIGEGYEAKISGGFNVLTKEYIMNVCTKGEAPEFSTLIYGVQQTALQCQSSYNYDKYLYYKNHLFGMKGSGTYELGIGNQIDGVNMECYLTGVSDKDIIADKEFIRIRVNSNSKPEKIYFYKSFADYKANAFDSVVDANASPLSIKNYFGYECYIPRSLTTPYERNQGRVAIFKIVSVKDEEFLVTSTAVQYKALK